MIFENADITGHSAMISLDPPESWKKLLYPWASERQRRGFHLTLVYLGEVAFSDLPRLKRVVQDAAVLLEPILIQMNGSGVFLNEDSKVRIVMPGGFGLNMWRVDLVRTLEANGFEIPKRYGFIPHMTLEYHDIGAKLPKGWEDVASQDFDYWECSSLDLVQGDTMLSRFEVG